MKFSRGPTCRSRKNWYQLPKLPSADILFRQFFDETFNYPINPKNYLTDHTFYYIHLGKVKKNDLKKFAVVLNSTLSCLFTEIYGRANMAEGVLTTYGPEMRPLLVIDPDKLRLVKTFDLEKFFNRPIKSIFEELGFDFSKLICEQEPNPLPDRKALDDIIFGVLGLTEEEKKEVYWAVAELVKNRLEKAKSV